MTEYEKMRADAFKAGVLWMRRNGNDHYRHLEADAEHYAKTNQDIDHGGFIAVRGGEQ